MPEMEYSSFVPMYNISLLELSLPTARRISRVGYIVSLSTLIVSFCILIGIRVLRCQRNKLHLHLFVSFMIRALMFLAEDSGLLEGALDVDIRFINGEIQLIEIRDEKSVSSPACKTFVSIWIYAIMANYSWILIEGLYLHNLIFLALMAPPLSIMRYIILGWGFPLPFLMCWIVLSSTSKNMLCWTESQNPAYFWTIRGPITASIIANFILFLNIIRVIYMKTFAPQSPRHCRYRKLFRSTLILLPLFGVHYTITTVTSTILQKHQEDELTWLQLDQVFSSIQGSVIACICCFLNSEVQSALWATWVKWKRTYGYLFTTRKQKCRKQSTERLRSQGNENNMINGPSILSSDHCVLCAQENTELVLRNSQETVLSFLDLEIKETEEGEINHFYAHESELSAGTVQTTCQKSAAQCISPTSEFSIVTADNVAASSMRLPSTVVFHPRESPSRTTKGSHDPNFKETVMEMISTRSNDLESANREGNQAPASADEVLFLLQPRDSEDGSHLNFPCHCGIVAEESSMKPGEIMKKEDAIMSHNIRPENCLQCCKHSVPDTAAARPTSFLVTVVPGHEEGHSQKCINSNEFLYNSESVNSSEANPDKMCGCQNAKMYQSKLNTSGNFNSFPKFHCIVTDLTASGKQKTAIDDAVITATGCEGQCPDTEVEFPGRIKMSVSFLEPLGSEGEATKISDELNEIVLPLCDEPSAVKFRRRSRSEGARWFRSTKESKDSKEPLECMEIGKIDPTLADGSPEAAVVPPLYEDTQESISHCNFGQSDTQQKGCGGETKSENPSFAEGKVCLGHYIQLKAIGKIQDFEQNFRPRSSSDCCNKRPNCKRHRSHEASPRIPPEWMAENGAPHKRKGMD